MLWLLIHNLLFRRQIVINVIKIIKSDDEKQTSNITMLHLIKPYRSSSLFIILK